MLGRVIVYSTLGCPHCLRAKSLLADHDLEYIDVAVDNYPPECYKSAHQPTELRSRQIDYMLTEAMTKLTVLPEFTVREEMSRRSGGKWTVPQIFFNQVHIGGCDDLEHLINNERVRFKCLVDMLVNETPPSGAPEPPAPSLALDKSRSVHEADGYAVLVRAIRDAGLPKTQVIEGETHHKCFTGRQLVEWLVENKDLEKEDALSMAAQLVLPGFGTDHKVDGYDENRYYSLLEDDDNNALNAGPAPESTSITLSELGEQMRSLIALVHSRHISRDGREVDYAAIGSDPDFDAYTTLARRLQHVKLEGATHDTKLAFFLNMYNSLFIHATVKLGAPTTLWQRWKFFNTVTYIIAGHNFALQDIENGVLRGNRLAVGAAHKQFGPEDPRLQVAFDKPEPMIHFALNCGGKSCPPVKTYSAENIINELQLATQSFLEDDTTGLTIDEPNMTVWTSPILQWYAEDFGGDKEAVLSWLADHVGRGAKRIALKRMIDTDKPIELKYLTYDWHLNAKSTK